MSIPSLLGHNEGITCKIGLGCRPRYVYSMLAHILCKYNFLYIHHHDWVCEATCLFPDCTSDANLLIKPDIPYLEGRVGRK